MRLVPFEDLRDDSIDFVVAEFWEHWERDAGSGIVFRVRERADFAGILAPRITGLLMNRDGIVRLRIDATVVQELEERVTLGRILRVEHIEMEHVAITWRFVRQGEMFRALEASGVTSGQTATAVIASVNRLELRAQHTSMNVVETTVEAEAVDVTSIGTMVAELANFRIDVRVVRDERTAVAERAEVLLNDEAGRSGIAEFADAETVAGSADGLGVIFDDEELMFVSDLTDGLHVSALTVKMDRDDRFGLRSNSGFDLRRIDALRFRIAVDQNGGSAGDPDCFCSSKESVGVSNAFVARTNAKSHQSQPDRVGAVAETDGVFGFGISREFSFESLEHGAENVLAALDDLLNVSINLFFEIVVLTNVSVEINFHMGGDVSEGAESGQEFFPENYYVALRKNRKVWT